MHNLSCENEFYLHENEKWFPYQRLTTYPRFEQRSGGTRKWPITAGLVLPATFISRGGMFSVINISMSLSILCYKEKKQQLVGSFLKYGYNHVLLEKTLRLYQIRYLTRLKWRIYFEHALFHHLSHSWQAGAHAHVTGYHVYKSDMTRSRLGLRQQEFWVGDYTKAPKCNICLVIYNPGFICMQMWQNRLCHIFSPHYLYIFKAQIWAKLWAFPLHFTHNEFSAS